MPAGGGIHRISSICQMPTGSSSLRREPVNPTDGVDDDCCRENSYLIADTSLSGARGP